MKKILDRVNARTFTPRSTIWFLLLIAALTYGLFFWQRGFYWDEFPWAWIYFRLGPEMLAKTFSTSRPFWGMIYQLTMPLVGPNPWAWQLLAMVLRWVTALLLWGVLRILFPAHPRPALWASLLFLVYPGMGQHFISMMYSHFYIVLSCYLLSLYLSLLALKNEKRRAVFFIASYVLAAANLLTMEYFYFLEFARVLFFWRALDGSQKERVRKSVLYFTPYLLIFAGVTVWRTFFFTFQNASYQYVLFDELHENFPAGSRLLVSNILLTFWRTVFEAWLYPILTIGSTGLGPLTLTLMLLLLFSVILLAGIYLFRFSPHESDDRNFARQAGLISLALWGLAGGSVWIIGVVPQLNFSMDRFMLPFMMGASLVLACMIAWMRDKCAQAVVLALLVGFAAGRHFRLDENFRRDWRTQQNLFQQMTLRIPALKKGAILLANDFPITYFSDNSLTGALNWIYSPPGEMNAILYYASFRVGSTLPSAEPGQPHQLYYIGPTFYGNTDDILVVYYQPPGCFRVVDPEVEESNRLLPPALRDVVKYSNQSVILPEKQNQLPPSLYRGEMPRNWCYYFNRAELARQMQDWEGVVEIGKVALTLDDTPNDPLERFVFIEGYAHTGEWQKAVELSRESYRVSKSYVGPPLCKLWSRIERSAPPAPERESALKAARNEFGCAP